MSLYVLATYTRNPLIYYTTALSIQHTPFDFM